MKTNISEVLPKFPNFPNYPNFPNFPNFNGLNRNMNDIRVNRIRRRGLFKRSNFWDLIDNNFWNA